MRVRSPQAETGQGDGGSGGRGTAAIPRTLASRAVHRHPNLRIASTVAPPADFPSRVNDMRPDAPVRPPEDDSAPGLSLVIPFYNEEESVEGVLAEARQCLPDAEILAVDDGSSDRTWEIIAGRADIRGIRLDPNQGQSAAILAGLRRARGPFCALLDGDGQNDPRDVQKLLDQLHAEGVDVVCGYRGKRRDSWSRRAASRWANRIRRAVVDDPVRDTGCSLKVFRREAVELLIPFNGMHRFLPAFFAHAGLRIAEAPVHHRPRRHGTSKYTNWDRALRGVHDLIGVRWFLRRRVDPRRVAADTHE